MLVGRGAERRTLDGLVAGARLGRSGVLLLVGEPGIGKTTLLDYVAAQAQEMDVVRVSGAEAEHDLPFAALTLLLSQRAADLDGLPGPQAAALRTALALEVGPTPDRFAVGAATLGMLTRRAESRPVALLLDDAHHLDRPSAEALLFAARRLVADPILLVAALRHDEPSALRSAGLPELAVGGLDLTDTAELLQSADSGPGPVVGREVWLHQATGGNPLAILELARGAAAPFPDSAQLAAPPVLSVLAVPAVLADGFVRRAAAVAPTATALLALVEAAAGDLRVVLGSMSVLHLNEDLIAQVERAGLLRADADRIVFTHPLVGSSAYASLTSDRRRELHSAVVAALPGWDSARRAWHRAAAALGPDDDAATALESVADDARRRGAHAVAASALERSAQLTDDPATRAEREVAAAAAAFDAGDGGWAVRLVDAASVGPMSSVTRGQANALRGAIATRGGSLGEAWSVLMRAAREVASEDPDQALRRVAEAVGVAFYLADGDVARETRRLAESLLERGVSSSSAGIGRLAVGVAQVLDGEDGSAQLREGGRLLGGEHARVTGDFDATWLLIEVLFLREQGATRRLLHAVEEARADTSLGALPHLLFHLARDEATTDRWAAAASDYSEAMALAAELGQTTEEAMARAGLAWLEARRGNEATSRAHGRRATALAAPRQVTIALTWALFALGDLELGAGRLDQALEHYSELAALLDSARTRDVDLSPAPELTEVLVRSGDLDRAAVVAAAYQVRARAKGMPWAMARAARAAGLLATDDDLDTAFGSALELHTRTPDVFETARTNLAYGARLRRSRRRVHARVPLQEAYDVFERLGARPWASAAADELAATGVTVAPHGATGLDLLTPRERQIAQLLVDGRTTRETAGALFLSPKTVEYHLRHVYTKLHITNRRELAELVQSGEPDEPAATEPSRSQPN